MGADAHFLDTCTIQESRVSQDELGNDVQGWATRLTDVRCRLVIKEQRVPFDQAAERPVITTYTLLVGPRAAIQQGEQITDITHRDGTVEAGPFRVDSILPRRARSVRHVSVKLERIP